MNSSQDWFLAVLVEHQPSVSLRPEDPWQRDMLVNKLMVSQTEPEVRFKHEIDFVRARQSGFGGAEGVWGL